MTIPKATYDLLNRLSAAWANRTWDLLDDEYGVPIAHLEFATLPEEERRLATEDYTEIKQYSIEDHNVYFLRHVSGAVHCTCTHGTDCVMVDVSDDESGTAYRSSTTDGREPVPGLFGVLRTLLRRWKHRQDTVQ